METSEFKAFWACYPRHVGKLAAMKAFQKARTVADQADILAGVARYVRTKPAYADWCHPTTWLNQGRWMDEEDTQPERQLREETRADCRHDPRCVSTEWHRILLARERARAGVA